MAEINTIAVLGSGTMGHGIAQVAAQARYNVILYDLQEDLVTAGFDRISGNLTKGIERGKLAPAEKGAALSRISGTTKLADAARADLVVEAVLEQLTLKQTIFRELDKLCSPETILATNTSSLSVADIADATGRPDKVLGMHFFNPVFIMKLLEIVVTAVTSEATLKTARAVATRLGKEAIVVKDSPGFASSRLGLALGLEAMRMLESGVASAADIDKAMVLGYNHPMGPLRLTD